ncbi:MAG TPA: FtsX-like permease family protein [Solirubrobacteraceae bacterium]|nr:FtsX-like permease family protein [Solirubrobacteraceae bacterium]
MSALRAAWIVARQGLRARRRRVLLTAVGIALAAAMLSAAVVVSYGLGTGFNRAARAASLADIVVRFNDKSERTVAARIAALPDVARYALRFEATNVSIDLDRRGERRDDAVAEVIDPGPQRGYAIVAGRDLRNVGSELLVERAFADSWGVRLGDKMDVRGLGPMHVVGFVEAPDNVGFPLAKPRFYVSRAAIDARFGREANPDANLAEIWLRNPRYVNEVLVQARDTSFGLHSITFATRAGVRILLDQAAGIVIDLLVALSLIALVTAGVMLAASARAEVQRRLGAIGVRRAVGTTRGQVTLAQALEGLLVAAPAATIGVLAGIFATYRPAARLLELLNEPAPGGALVLPLLGAWLVAALTPALGAAWPAWRAGGGPVVELLRGADVSRARRSSRPAGRRAGLAILGARLVGARRARLVATALTLGLSIAFVLLMLALASALSTLETDPGALGKRYQLTATLPPSAAARVARIPGVQSAAARYDVQAADSFALGETINVIAFGGDHTRFEAPSLVSGRRLRGSREAEVGEGLAQALGLTQGSTLALALPSGGELRLRVAGIVSSLQHDGRVAYVPSSALLRADPSPPALIAVRLVPGADQASVTRALTALGGEPAIATAATARGAPLVDTLRTILRAVAIVDGLVCLYALIQACALTVQERRRTVAVVRACGAGAGAVRRLLLGATLALVVPAAVTGILLEHYVFGPALSRLAENYATLPLDANLLDVLATVAGLGVAAGVAIAWVARQSVRESVVAGLAA